MFIVDLDETRLNGELISNVDGNYEICLKFFLNPSMTMDGNERTSKDGGIEGKKVNGGMGEG